ncbi:helix-turn-helix domain-containing protein [Flindersiella endophytica]
MTDGTTGSTVPRRQLGRHLRDLRNRARYTVRAAAKALEWSEAKMWRIETGQTSMRAHDVRLMCQIYAAPPRLVEVLAGLAAETKAKGWWHSYSGAIPEWFNVYVGLEEAAAEISEYQSDLVPGLLQTADYFRTMVRKFAPDIADDELERRVELRITRQALLTRRVEPPQFNAVLSESILQRPIGEGRIMAAQMRHLAKLSDLPNVSLRVIPFRAGYHPGVDTGAFVLLHFPRNVDGSESEPPVVYIEGITGALYLEKPPEIETFAGVFTSLVDSALDVRASQSYILQAAREFEQ